MSDDAGMRDDDPRHESVAPRKDGDDVAGRASGDEEQNQESVDRAFAELVAGFHLTADRPEPPTWERPDLSAPGPGAVFEPPRPPELDLPDLDLPAPEPEIERQEESFDPGPPPPLPRPAWPVLVGWIGLGYAMLTVLLVAVRVPLPAWAAWAGVIGFVGGFGLLISRLPRQRPPDAGDGAVL